MGGVSEQEESRWESPERMGLGPRLPVPVLASVRRCSAAMGVVAGLFVYCERWILFLW